MAEEDERSKNIETEEFVRFVRPYIVGLPPPY